VIVSLAGTVEPVTSLLPASTNVNVRTELLDSTVRQVCGI